MKLYGKLHYKRRSGVYIINMFRFEDFSQSYCPLIFVHPAFCWLFLSNHWFDINETLWEASLSREGVNIIPTFRLDDFLQSDCLFISSPKHEERGELLWSLTVRRRRLYVRLSAVDKLFMLIEYYPMHRKSLSICQKQLSILIFITPLEISIEYFNMFYMIFWFS